MAGDIHGTKRPWNTGSENDSTHDDLHEAREGEPNSSPSEDSGPEHVAPTDIKRLREEKLQSAKKNIEERAAGLLTGTRLLLRLLYENFILGGELDCLEEELPDAPPYLTDFGKEDAGFGRMGESESVLLDKELALESKNIFRRLLSIEAKRIERFCERKIRLQGEHAIADNRRSSGEHSSKAADEVDSQKQVRTKHSHREYLDATLRDAPPGTETSQTMLETGRRMDSKSQGKQRLRFNTQLVNESRLLKLVELIREDANFEDAWLDQLRPWFQTGDEPDDITSKIDLHEFVDIPQANTEATNSDVEDSANAVAGPGSAGNETNDPDHYLWITVAEQWYRLKITGSGIELAADHEATSQGHDDDTTEGQEEVPRLIHHGGKPKPIQRIRTAHWIMPVVQHGDPHSHLLRNPLRIGCDLCLYTEGYDQA